MSGSDTDNEANIDNGLQVKAGKINKYKDMDITPGGTYNKSEFTSWVYIHGLHAQERTEVFCPLGKMLHSSVLGIYSIKPLFKNRKRS